MNSRFLRQASVLAVLVTLLALVGSASFAEPASAACIAPSKIGITFVIDDSGSMSSTDPYYLRSDATRIGLSSLPDGTTAAVTTFSSYAYTVAGPVDLTPANRQGIYDDVYDSLESSGSTSYGEAFDLANTVTAQMPGVDKKAIVFLSDGEPTDGFDGTESSVRTGVPVYTIGFGVADPSILEAIASGSGGSSYYTDDTPAIQDAFSDIVSKIACDSRIVTDSVDLAPGQTQSFPFDTEDDGDSFSALATWDYGNVSVRIRRPDGSYMVDGAEGAGEAIDYDSNSARASSQIPPVGHWAFEVTADQDNAENVHATIGVWRRSKPKDLRVVIVPGLTAENPGISLGSGASDLRCRDVGNLFELCRDLVSRQFPVDVVSSGKQGAKKGSTQLINSLGDLDGSARRLAKYVKSLGSQNVLLVGYSRGGLIARQAVALEGAPVKGIVTFGSPHNGSFWADAALSSGWLGSAVMGIFSGLQGSTQGVEAIVDMSSAATTARNGLMPKLGVPIWTVGGNGCPVNNDCIVSLSSAYGNHAKFGRNPANLLADGWKHSEPNSWGVRRPVIEAVRAALNTFKVKRMRAARSNGSGSGLSIAAKKKAKKPTKAAAALGFVRVARARIGRKLPTRVRAISFSSSAPFVVACGRSQLSSIDPFGLGSSLQIKHSTCKRPKLLSAGAKVIVAMSPKDRPRGTWRFNKGKTSLKVSARTRIQKAKLSRVRARGGCSGSRCAFRLRSAPGAGAFLQVKTGGHVYAAVLPNR